MEEWREEEEEEEEERVRWIESDDIKDFCCFFHWSWHCVYGRESHCPHLVVFDARHSGVLLPPPWENPNLTSVLCNTMRPLIYELIASYLLIGTNYPANCKLMETWWGMIVFSQAFRGTEESMRLWVRGTERERERERARESERENDGHFKWWNSKQRHLIRNAWVYNNIYVSLQLHTCVGKRERAQERGRGRERERKHRERRYNKLEN